MASRRRRRKPLVAAVLAASLSAAHDGRAAPPDHPERAYVAVHSTARGLACQSYGSGLAVGDGLVLSAAHVLLTQRDLVSSCAIAESVARTADFAIFAAVGTQAPSAVRRLDAGTRLDDPGGAMTFVAAGDWVILGGLAGSQRVQTPCTATPVPGQAVRVVLSNRGVPAHVALHQTEKAGADAGYWDLDRVFAEGTSGAGVLDAGTGCVLGIISHRYREPHPRVTRMTAVETFAAAWRRAAR